MDSYRVTQFGKPLERQSEATPAPRGREVLVRVTGCGVCHSDVHLREGAFDLGGGRKVDLAKTMPLPLTMGHEIVGEVEAVGPDVNPGEAKAGDRRVVFPWVGCGRCGICASGEEQLCNQPRALGVNIHGGYATHAMVPGPQYLFGFDGLDHAQAATLACSGLTAYGALKKAKAAMTVAGATTGDVLIMGAGGVGLSGVRMCEAVTGRAPVVADIDKSKWSTAKAAGARETIDPEAGRALYRLTNGGPVAVIDFVGAAASFTFGFNAVRKGGRVVVVGLFGGAATIPVPMIPLKNVTVMGSYVGNLVDMAELMVLARSGKVPSLPVATRPLAEVDTVLGALADGKIVGRTVVVP